MKLIKKKILFCLLVLFLINCSSQKKRTNQIKIIEDQEAYPLLVIKSFSLLQEIEKSLRVYEKNMKEDAKFVIIRINGNGKTIQIETKYYTSIDKPIYKSIYNIIAANKQGDVVILLNGTAENYKLYKDIFSIDNSSKNYTLLYGGNINQCQRVYELNKNNSFNFIKQDCNLE
jgi:hypothetical protein